MVIKVNEKTIPIKRTLPIESQNSDSPYHLTANRLIALNDGQHSAIGKFMPTAK